MHVVPATPVTDFFYPAATPTVTTLAYPPTLFDPDSNEPEVHYYVIPPTTLLSWLSSAVDWFLYAQYTPFELLTCLVGVLAICCIPLGPAWMIYLRAKVHIRQGRQVDLTSTLIGKMLVIFAFLRYLSCAFLKVVPSLLLWFLHYTWMEIQGSFEAIKVLTERAVHHWPRRSVFIMRLLFGFEEHAEPLHELLVIRARETIRRAYHLGTVIGLASFHYLGYRFNWYNNRPSQEEEDYVRRSLIAPYQVLSEDWHMAKTTRFADLVHLFAEKRYLEGVVAALNERLEIIPKLNGNIKELGKKCEGLRLSHIEALKDMNYLRVLIGNILNHCLNVHKEVHPNGPHAIHPFMPSQYSFIPEADHITGLHYTINEKLAPKLASFKWSFLAETRKMVFNSREAPKYMPAFIAARFNSPFLKVDPFEEDGWLLSCIFPDLLVPPYRTKDNPYNPTKKKVKAIEKPEARFGPQIEHYAVTGKLVQWPPKGPKGPPRSVPPSKPDTRLGGSRRVQFVMPTTPRPQPPYLDPCPDGSPMNTSPIVWGERY